MKKLLLASAAVALSAGAVSAQGITITGDARMGLDYNNNRSIATRAVGIVDGEPVIVSTPSNRSNWQMTSRARVIFTLSGTSDSGFDFGASFRADQTDDGEAPGNTEMRAGSVFVSGSFGRITMGDAAGAARARVGDLAFTSLTGVGDPNEMAYVDRLQQGGLLNDVPSEDATLRIVDRRTAARYDYTFEGFTFSVSLDQFRSFDVSVIDPTATGNVDATGWSVAAGYDFGMGMIALGYERLDVDFPASEDFSAGHIILGGEVEFSGITFKAIYGQADSDLKTLLRDGGNDDDQYGFSVAGTFDAITASAFWRTDFFRTDRFGVGASYDLGGGASVVGSIARINPDGDVDSTTRGDFGIAMRF